MVKYTFGIKKLLEKSYYKSKENKIKYNEKK